MKFVVTAVVVFMVMVSFCVAEDGERLVKENKEKRALVENDHHHVHIQDNEVIVVDYTDHHRDPTRDKGVLVDNNDHHRIPIRDYSPPRKISTDPAAQGNP